MDNKAIKTKICSSCKIEKELTSDNYQRDRSRLDGYHYYCKTCVSDKWQQKYYSNPQKFRLRANNNRKLKIEQDPLYPLKYKLQRVYRISYEQYIEIFENQNRSCKICKTTQEPARGWQIDHDHSCCDSSVRRHCGKCIRGILCELCNWGLGHFKDDPEILKEATKYLENYKKEL